MRFLLCIICALCIAAAAANLLAASLSTVASRIAVVECSTDTDCCAKNPSICE